MTLILRVTCDGLHAWHAHIAVYNAVFGSALRWCLAYLDLKGDRGEEVMLCILVSPCLLTIHVNVSF